jgi:ComF family protein
MFGDKIEYLLDIFSTHNCKVCHRPVIEDIGQRYLCEVCYEAALHSIYSSYKPDPELEIYFATDYMGWARKMMRDYKYRKRHLARFWSKLLSDYISREWSEILSKQQVYIASIPLHPYKLKKRGYDQAELLANGLKRFEYLPQLLERVRDTASLYTFKPAQRESMLSDAFRLNPAYHHDPSFKRSVLILIDDITTTGATFKTCARLVRDRLGFKAVIAIAAAGRNLD